ncbi:adhesion g protein-coupled receptor l3 [Plakobranchus ocellatus]|uniref:Adhesion g protein-coupled receptor l3 n=1 Tax=Plakobranchus ocellatus TaxID=259542 RepID=A0AAV3Y519_9GAST|nr:adhesion g protein-coupled receptor l3 [Plakobranchus ocellatus]
MLSALGNALKKFHITIVGSKSCECPQPSIQKYIENHSSTDKLTDQVQNSAYCQAGADDKTGSMIFWYDTLAGDDAFRPCPEGSIGYASRHCLLDKDSKTGGLWTRPDLSQCVSPELFQISLDATALLSDGFAYSSAKEVQVLNITARLANATNTVSALASKERFLFPGDLLTSADVMQKLSIAASEGLIVGETEAVAITRASNYTQAVDNIVDPNTETTWRNARASLVEDKVSSVVASTQALIVGVAKGLSLPADDNFSEVSERRETLLNISGRNLEIFVNRVNRSQNNTAYMFDYSAGSSTVSLPIYELDGSGGGKQGHAVNIYMARFQSIAKLLSMKEGRYTKQNQNDSNIINSDIISAEVLTDDDFSHMRNPVELVFRLQKPERKEALQEKCVFMNMSARSYSDRWSSEGCYVSSANETHVVCHCYHLTNFAVLMDVYNNQENLDSTQDAILSYISYIGGSLSIVSCVIAICVFQYFRLSSDRVRIHQQLGVSIVLVQILYICVVNTGSEYNTPVWGCRVLAILMHYSLTAMFCWMLVEGIHLYVVLVRVFKQGSHIKKYSAIGWGVPLVVVAVSVAAFRSRYGTGKLCWLDSELLLVCFVPTVGLVLMINTVVLATVIRVMVKSNSSTNKIGTAERNSLRATTFDMLRPAPLGMLRKVPLARQRPASVVMLPPAPLVLRPVVCQGSTTSYVKASTSCHANASTTCMLGPPTLVRILFRIDEMVRAGLKATLVLLPLLGLTWVLGFLAIRQDQSEAVSYIFTYLFTVTNSCQGVFFLVVHCLLNVDVHQAYERQFSRKKRLSYADTTSSRLRKLSEHDLFPGSNNSPGKSTVHQAYERQFSRKKRLSYADTTSSRLRKLSEHDLFPGSNNSPGKSTTTTRSTLTNLSVGLPRLSFMGHPGDKHPIIGLEDNDGLSQVTAPTWHGFTSGHIPEPDYPQQDFPVDRFGIDNPVSYPPQDRSIKDGVVSGLIIPRPQRNSVRFSTDSDLSF